jgi:hypothetical protein
MVVFVREVMADNAAGDRAENGVMMREMARDGANGCALEASLRLSVAGKQSRQSDHDDKSDGEALHCDALYGVAEIDMGGSRDDSTALGRSRRSG